MTLSGLSLETGRMNCGPLTLPIQKRLSMGNDLLRPLAGQVRLGHEGFRFARLPCPWQPPHGEEVLSDSALGGIQPLHDPNGEADSVTEGSQPIAALDQL